MQHWMIATRSTSSHPRSTAADAAPRIEFTVKDGQLATVGDAVVLLRTGLGPGAVAHGSVTAIIERAIPATARERSRAELGRLFGATASEPAEVTLRLAQVTLDSHYLGTPVATDQLPPGTPWVNKQFRPSRFPVVMKMPEAAYHAIVARSTQPRHGRWPATWPIAAGTALRRRELHDYFGGRERVAITASATTPNIFVFTRPSAAAGRFHDDGSFLVHGMNAHGSTLEYGVDQVVRTHLLTGLPLRIFREDKGGICTYLGEAVIDEEKLVERWSESRYTYNFNDGTTSGTAPQMTPLLRLLPVTDISTFTQALSADQPKRAGLAQLRLTTGVNTPQLLQPVPKPTPAQRDQPEPGAETAATAQVQALLGRVLATMRANPDTAQAAAGWDESTIIMDLLRKHSRRIALDELRSAVDDPATSEHTLNKMLAHHGWIFGGEFTGKTLRRRITATSILDLTLVRHDGSLHSVELKRANIPKLIDTNHGVPSAGPPVWDAYTQADNYLAELDEQSYAIEKLLKVDCRRTTMTVVIGHSRFASAAYPPEEISRALRTFNGGHSRIKVITYDQLLHIAEQNMQLA